jgi:hypothetical protein
MPLRGGVAGMARRLVKVSGFRTPCSKAASEAAADRRITTRGPVGSCPRSPSSSVALPLTALSRARRWALAQSSALISLSMTTTTTAWSPSSGHCDADRHKQRVFSTKATVSNCFARRAASMYHRWPGCSAGCAAAQAGSGRPN